jgi:hypothetical protein
MSNVVCNNRFIITSVCSCQGKCIILRVRNAVVVCNVQRSLSLDNHHAVGCSTVDRRDDDSLIFVEMYFAPK